MQHTPPPGLGGLVLQSCALLGAWFAQPCKQVPPAEAQALPVADDELHATPSGTRMNQTENHRTGEVYFGLDGDAAASRLRALSPIRRGT
jgi:hypothetical protein